MVPDFHKSEDLLQRTAVAVASKFPLYDGERPFIGWALGMAKIEVLRFRQESKRDRLVFEPATLDVVACAFEQSAVEISDLRAALRRCLQRLQGRARQVLELHYLQEFNPAQISQRLGISQNAVLVRLHRARTALRECMEKGTLSASAGEAP
jgi:RNA polymerase sigma-70 factor (ECF subfamily)